MQRFKSAGSAQKFLSTHAAARPRRQALDSIQQLRTVTSTLPDLTAVISNPRDGIDTLPHEERERILRGLRIFKRLRQPRATCSSPRRGARGVIELT